MNCLKGKIIIVTGAGSGIGRAQVIEFLNRGANVIAGIHHESDIPELVEEAKSLEGELYPLLLEVTDPRSIAEVVDKTIDKYGRIDVLCNTAGGFDNFVTVTDCEEAMWDKVMNLDLKSVYLMSKAVLPQMLKQEKGNIINMASMASHRATGGGAPYCAAKHAVAGLTKRMAYDYGSKGIRVNAIVPGLIPTRMTFSYTDDTTTDAYKTFTAIPAGRLGHDYEIAYATAFLASDESDYIVGALLPVEGGGLIQ